MKMDELWYDISWDQTEWKLSYFLFEHLPFLPSRHPPPKKKYTLIYNFPAKFPTVRSAKWCCQLGNKNMDKAAH